MSQSSHQQDEDIVEICLNLPQSQHRDDFIEWINRFRDCIVCIDPYIAVANLLFSGFVDDGNDSDEYSPSASDDSHEEDGDEKDTFDDHNYGFGMSEQSHI